MTMTYAQKALLEYMAEHATDRYDRESIAAALADLDVCRAVLRSLEWCVMYEDDAPIEGFRCAACDKSESDGHARDCRLAAVLAAAGGGDP